MDILIFTIQNLPRYINQYVLFIWLHVTKTTYLDGKLWNINMSDRNWKLKLIRFGHHHNKMLEESFFKYIYIYIKLLNKLVKSNQIWYNLKILTAIIFDCFKKFVGSYSTTNWIKHIIIKECIFLSLVSGQNAFNYFTHGYILIFVGSNV